jgi:hypothetical protein
MQLSSWLCIDDVCWLQWSFPAMLNRTSWRELFGTSQLFMLMSVIISRFVMNLIDHFHFLQKFSWYACFLMQIMCIPTRHGTSSYAIYCLQIASETHSPGGTTWSESYLCCKRSCIFLYLPQAGNVQPHVRQLIVAQIWIVIEGGRILSSMVC